MSETGTERKHCPECGGPGTPKETPPDGQKLCQNENCPIVLWDVEVLRS